MPYSDYTPEEHHALMNAAAEVLFAALVAERSGPIAYFREIWAAGSFIYDARRRYADNQLVQDLFDHADDDEEQLALPEVVNRESLLAEMERVGAILRHDAEGDGFRRFLVELAERVVQASRNGLFRRRVSPDEEAFLAELKQRLRA